MAVTDPQAMAKSTWHRSARLIPVLEIRPEQAEDVEAIEALTIAAFRSAAHADGREQDVIAGLRAAGALRVSLVAVEAGEIVGHVAVSPVTIADGSADWYGLGPISVAPTRQRQGIGSALMAAALEALRRRQAQGCVLLGDPAYYARFGFRSLPSLTLPGVDAKYFQALPFSERMPAGAVTYHAAFGA